MISRKETKQLQGLAILAMLCLHLFCTLTPTFVPTVYVTGVPLVYFFGQAADFCVMAYCFCSGYGLMYAYAQVNGDRKKYMRGRVKGLWSFLKNYWLILILFACVAIALGKGTEWLGSPIIFLKNATSIWYSYNGAWWFVSTYIFMVLLSPCVFSMVQKHPKVIAVVAVIVYMVSYKVRFGGAQDLLLQHIVRLGMSYAELLLGVYFYQYQLMDWVQHHWDRLIPRYLQLWILVLVTVAAIIVRRYIATLFIAPVSGMVFILVYLLLSRKYHPLQAVFGFFGSHSTNMWLVHMFLYLPMYGGLAYFAKYDVFVFISLVIMSLCVSYTVEFIQKVFTKSIKTLRRYGAGVFVI